MYDIHCRAEADNQPAISIVILCERLLSFLEKLEDRLGRRMARMSVVHSTT